MALVLLISAHGGFIYRHDRPFSLEQVSESKHAAPFLLDVVAAVTAMSAWRSISCAAVSP